jgi:hypothetical protein
MSGTLHDELTAFIRAASGEIDIPVTVAEAADAVRVVDALNRSVQCEMIMPVNYP